MWAYPLTMALVWNGDGGEEPRTRTYSPEELMLLKYVDPIHPRPGWVDALASKPRSSIVAEFKRLGEEQQIEFAVFMRSDQHPPDLNWMFLLAEEGKKILPLMEKSIAAEKASSSRSASWRSSISWR